MRFLSFGRTEARWWMENVFEVRDCERNASLVALGLPEDVCRDAINPGFTDPFDVDADVTLCNHRGYYSVCYEHLS